MTAVKGFSEISYDELMDVNGGFDLVDLGGAVVVGAVVVGAGVGALGGAAAGGVGAGPGAVIGGLLGGIGYLGLDLWSGIFGRGDYASH